MAHGHKALMGRRSVRYRVMRLKERGSARRELFPKLQTSETLHTRSLTIWEKPTYSPRQTGRDHGMAGDTPIDLLQGTLDMLVLKAVSLGPLHGYGVLLRIQQISQNRLEIQQGSLYPALYRLEHEGWIAGEWGQSENKRRARFYRLTAAGRKRLEAEARKWNLFADVVGSILSTAPEQL